MLASAPVSMWAASYHLKLHTKFVIYGVTRLKVSEFGTFQISYIDLWMLTDV